MPKTRKKLSVSKPDPFPWLPLILFLASIYLFWFLPRQLGTQPPSVEFSDAR